MKFIDEVTISVTAGRGGDGSASFRREKYVPFGGPDGGDGGRGGDLYMEATTSCNTLVDFRYTRRFQAENGEPGRAQQCFGRSGQDCVIAVPLGTIIHNAETGSVIGELLEPGQRMLIAKGGNRGLGNLNFKTSTNRAPRRTTKGKPGEHFELQLELQVLADVGLLGFPNAGKSTLISAVSSAKPKIADYPFTTLHPHLGVVRLGPTRHFVMADIPGLIEGASEGHGLGHQFLRHLSRTGLLLQVVDGCPIDGSDPVEHIRIVVSELENYSEALLEKPRWLVLNKMDCLLPDEQETLLARVREAVGSEIPIHQISAHTKEGTQALSEAVFQALEAAKAARVEAAPPADPSPS